MADERADAIILANKVLDRPSHDPDDDIAMLARQFLRAREAVDKVAPAAQLVYQKFAEDLRIGYRTKDREYAVSILGMALGLPTRIETNVT